MTVVVELDGNINIESAFHLFPITKIKLDPSNKINKKFKKRWQRQPQKKKKDQKQKESKKEKEKKKKNKMEKF